MEPESSPPLKKFKTDQHDVPHGVKLSKDVWGIIYKKLSVKDILNLSTTSKELSSALQMDSLWRSLFIRDFPDVLNDLSLEEATTTTFLPDFVRDLTPEEKENVLLWKRSEEYKYKEKGPKATREFEIDTHPGPWKREYKEKGPKIRSFEKIHRLHGPWKRAYFWCYVFIHTAERKLVQIINTRGYGPARSKEFGTIVTIDREDGTELEKFTSIEFVNNMFHLELDYDAEFGAVGGGFFRPRNVSRMTIASNVKEQFTERDFFYGSFGSIGNFGWSDFRHRWKRNRSEEKILDVFHMFFRYWDEKMRMKYEYLLKKDDAEIKSDNTSYQVPGTLTLLARGRIGNTFLKEYGDDDSKKEENIVYAAQMKNFARRHVRRSKSSERLRMAFPREIKLLQWATLTLPRVWGHAGGFSTPDPKSKKERRVLYLGCNYCNSNSLEGRESYNSNSSSLMRCKGCKTTLYCGKKCQLKDWDNHKLECK